MPAELPLAIAAFLASGAGIVFKAIFVAAFLDFFTGVMAAIRDGTFEAGAIAAFIRKHLAGRVFPVGTALVVGYLAGDGVILAGATVAGGAYAAETISSVLGNFSPPKAVDKAETAPTVAELANPVPED